MGAASSPPSSSPPPSAHRSASLGAARTGPLETVVTFWSFRGGRVRIDHLVHYLLSHAHCHAMYATGLLVREVYFNLFIAPFCTFLLPIKSFLERRLAEQILGVKSAHFPAILLHRLPLRCTYLPTLAVAGCALVGKNMWDCATCPECYWHCGFFRPSQCCTAVNRREVAASPVARCSRECLCSLHVIDSSCVLPKDGCHFPSLFV